MFGASGSIQLVRLFGIRVGVNRSWFVVLFFFIFLLSGSFKDTLDSSDTTAYLTAVASALSFFASLVMHEMGHALMARRLGIGIAGIDLWFFGGVARMTRDTDTPEAEFKVAIAGPVVTLLVVAACVGLGIALDGKQAFWDAATLASGAHLSPGLVLLAWLATINAALLVFNMVPAFPLDGGRVARAIAWKITGDRLRATRVAASLGTAFSYVLMGLGLAQIIVFGSLVSGLWMLVLGMFLGQAARGAVAQTAFSERLGAVTVEDIMDREPVSIPSPLSAVRAEEEFFLRYRWPWFPVVDPSGRFIGLVRQERITSATAAGDGSLAVADLMEADDGEWHVSQDEPIEALLGSEPLRRVGALMAVDPDGVLRGVVTIDQVRRALQSAVGTGPAVG